MRWSILSKNKTIWCNQGWQPVKFAFVPSKKAWKKTLKEMQVKSEYPKEDATVTHFNVVGSPHKRTCLVTVTDDVSDRCDSVQIIALIVHEATHVWQYILDTIGETKPSSEFEAYSVQAIVQELLDAYEKTRGKLTT